MFADCAALSPRGAEKKATWETRLQNTPVISGFGFRGGGLLFCAVWAGDSETRQERGAAQGPNRQPALHCATTP